MNIPKIPKVNFGRMQLIKAVALFFINPAAAIVYLAIPEKLPEKKKKDAVVDTADNYHR